MTEQSEPIARNIEYRDGDILGLYELGEEHWGLLLKPEKEFQIFKDCR